jgi:hypothetical protein
MVYEPPPPDSPPARYKARFALQHVFQKVSNICRGLRRIRAVVCEHVLVHAIHLDEEDVDLVKSRDVGVSHCLMSSFNLTSGVAWVGELLGRIGGSRYLSFVVCNGSACADYCNGASVG